MSDKINPREPFPNSPLALALSKAQGSMRAAIKDADNPFFKSKYADLASVWDACRYALSQNELAVSQIIDMVDGNMILRTLLMHASGEKLEGVMPMQLSDKATAQQVGSLITYYRRYALSAIVGVAPEDDDGNKASETPVKSPIKKWAESKPGDYDKLKADTTEFVKQIEMSETVTELEDKIEKGKKLVDQLESKLPDWHSRTKLKIEQCREAFELADH